MSAIVHSPSALRPLDLIRQALAWCQMQGIHCEIGEYGIEHTGHRWWLAPGKNCVDPLAAVVLFIQPRGKMMPEAAAEALGTHIAFTEGLSAGIERRVPSTGWTNTPRKQLFLDGFEAGVQLRMAFLTVVCARDNVRHRRDQPCPLCEEREITARDREPV